MKLLIDQNISSQIIDSIQDVFEGSVHVNQLEFTNMTDYTLWNYALENDFVLVSTDKAFFNYSIISDKLSKVVYVGGGLINNTKLEWVLRINEQVLTQFKQAESLTCLELNI